MLLEAVNGQTRQLVITTNEDWFTSIVVTDHLVDVGVGSG